MNFKIFIPAYLLFCIISACNRSENIDLSSELSGTRWVNNTDSRRYFTFISYWEYVYVAGGKRYPGTYAFNGKRGVLKHNVRFKVKGKTLSVGREDLLTLTMDFE